MACCLVEPAFANEGMKKHLSAFESERMGLKDPREEIKSAAARISSLYGARVLRGRTGFHQGIDIAVAAGTPIKAFLPGIVIRAGWAGAYGYMVELYHGKGVTTRYAHMSQVSVTPMKYVPRGGGVGFVGSTGRSTGNHLHFEIRVGGKSIDPMSIRKNRQAAQK